MIKLKKGTVLVLIVVLLFGCCSLAAQADTKIQLNKTKSTLYVGQSTTLKVKGSKKVTWISSRKSIATVNKDGKVTAKKKGTAEIVAKVGKKKAQCKIIVKARKEETGKDNNPMKILVKSAEHEVIYELNNSQAAKELYSQLPLAVELEDYSTNEKIFYPPEKLNINNTPLAEGGKGSLSYYSPWADVVMFYDDFSKVSGLYELGEAISGANDIDKLEGTIDIIKLE